MKKKKRIGLVLGSGSARGWSHIGVIHCLQEKGVPIDIVCGCSVGAVVGGAYAAGILDALEELAREFSWFDFLKFIDVSLSRRGLIEGNRITEFFRNKISNISIEELPLPYGSVAVDLQTGREISFRKGPLLDAMRASFALPGLFTPFQKGSQWLIDGGLVNPVPVSLCRAMGADVVIAVNLNDGILEKNVPRKSTPNANPTFQEKLFDVLKSDFIPTSFPFLKKTDQPETIQCRTPNVIDVIMRSIYIMQDRITRQRMLVDPPDVLISPNLSGISLLEFNKAKETIQEGWLSTNRIMPEILEKTA